MTIVIVVLMPSGPHKIELDVMAVELKHQTIWIDHLLTGVGPITIEKQTEEAKELKSIVLTMKSELGKIKLHQGTLMGKNQL